MVASSSSNDHGATKVGTVIVSSRCFLNQVFAEFDVINAVGLKSRDELGEGFAQKPTGFMGNCEEILNELDQVCPNRYLPADQHHRRVELLRGRAKACERYPVTLIKAIVGGVRKHLGTIAGDGITKIFSLEPGELGPNLDEPAEDFSRWRMSQKNKFFDEYTGLELDPKLVRQGRTGEMDFMAELGKRVGCKDGIWDVVPVSVCMERTGKPPIGVRWVEHGKNAGSDPSGVRCRLVVQEIKRVTHWTRQLIQVQPSQAPCHWKL